MASKPAQLGQKLTSRERDVIQRLIEGETNETIAKQLGISPATVKFHVYNIITKLGARNRTHAAVIHVRMLWNAQRSQVA